MRKNSLPDISTDDSAHASGGTAPTQVKERQLGTNIGAEKPVRRILFILQYFYPDVTGFSQMLGDLALHLTASGRYQCTVLSGSTVRSTRKWVRLPDRLGNVTIRRIRTLSTGKRSILHRLLEYSAFYIGVTLRLFLNREFDAVVCFSTPPLIGFAAATGLSLARTPFIYYVQDLYPELLYDMGYVRNPWVIRRLSVLNRLVFRRADKIVTIGRWMAKKLERNYGLRPSRLSVVENWAMGISFAPPTLTGPFVVLYSGNIGLAHDFSLLGKLLGVLAAADDGPSAVEFRFVGSGRQYKSIERMFAARPRIRCSFSGYVERNELNALLSSAHVFLIAQSDFSVGDILPSKFYSYLAAGRPQLFIGTRKSEIGEAIVENRIGSVLECDGDVNPSAECLRRFALRGADFQAACARAADLYEKRLGFIHSAEKFEAILREVLKA